MEGNGQQAWLDRLAAEHDNIRTVLAWSCTTPAATELGLRSRSPRRIWWRHGFLREERAGWSACWRNRAARLRPGRRPPQPGRNSPSYGRVCAGDRLFDESLTYFRELGDRLGIARTLLQQGRSLRLQGDYERAMPLEEESLALFQTLQDRVALRARW